MGTNRCHCGEPAPWVAAVVATTSIGSLSEYADDAWATCDDHMAEGARQLVERQGDRPRSSYRLVLRGPDDTERRAVDR